MAFNISLLKKNEEIEVERHRLSDLSRVTKLVSVRARARSQPTYPVIFTLPFPKGSPGSRDREGKVEWGTN